MKKYLFFGLLVMTFPIIFKLKAQERVVKVDFESGSFYNNPKIPFDQPFLIQGEAGKEIEMVKVNIKYHDKDYVLHSYLWNRYDNNPTETFSIVVPGVLKSGTKYDFEIITYKAISHAQKLDLLKNIENRVRFLLKNNIYFDGKKVVVNKPVDVYHDLKHLIKTALELVESKNGLQPQAPSMLVLEELKKQREFHFSRLFKKTKRLQKDSLAEFYVDKKIEEIVKLVRSELIPYFNSQLVQQYRMVVVNSVETDKEPYTLPVNAGFYAWNKSTNINNISTNNINFTPGVGISLPFNNKSRLANRTKMFDSFAFSMGVLLDPVRDGNGKKFVTPSIDLPLYTGIGLRLFKVLRFNGGVLILGEKGISDYSALTFLPTFGLALELNLWLGIKK